MTIDARLILLERIVRRLAEHLVGGFGFASMDAELKELLAALDADAEEAGR